MISPGQGKYFPMTLAQPHLAGKYGVNASRRFDILRHPSGGDVLG
jgi:hypothetical protein